jgi:hypothetical protein
MQVDYTTSIAEVKANARQALINLKGALIRQAEYENQAGSIETELDTLKSLITSNDRHAQERMDKYVDGFITDDMAIDWIVDQETNRVRCGILEQQLGEAEKQLDSIAEEVDKYREEMEALAVSAAALVIAMESQKAGLA